MTRHSGRLHNLVTHVTYQEELRPLGLGRSLVSTELPPHVISASDSSHHPWEEMQYLVFKSEAGSSEGLPAFSSSCATWGINKISLGKLDLSLHFLLREVDPRLTELCLSPYVYSRRGWGSGSVHKSTCYTRLST